MYATENYVKFEARVIKESLNVLANDMAGDITHLNNQIRELQNTVYSLIDQLQELSRKLEDKHV